MKKHTKGAVAAGTAAVLLLGGASTLAYWSDGAPIGGVDISTGELSLGEVTSSGWTYGPGTHEGDPVTLIVPGDSIVQEHTFTINAKGDHLAAMLDAPATVEATITSGGTPTTLQLPVTATYTIDGADVPARITEANDGDVVTANVVVSFPWGTVDSVNANDTQGLVASLDDLTVALTQVQD